MEWMREQVRLIYKETRTTYDHRTSLQAIGEMRKQTELFQKLLGDLEIGQEERREQEWVSMRETIFGALEAHPDARLAVARALLALDGDNGHDTGQQLGQALPSRNIS
jgi:hypothetical protein